MTKFSLSVIALGNATLLAACSPQQQAQVQVDAAAVCALGQLAVSKDPALAKHNPTAVGAITAGCAAAPQVGAILAPAITAPAPAPAAPAAATPTLGPSITPAG